MRTTLRTRRVQAVAAAATLLAGLTIASPGVTASAATDSVPLPGSAIPFTASSPVIGNAPGSQRLSIQVWLRPRIAAAQRFADAVSTPGGPQFGHFLSPDRYTARFGATAAEERDVESWLRSAGFTGVTADAQRTYVRASAATPTIDAALRTRLRLYRSSAAVNAGPYVLRANDKSVSAPARLAASVIGVTGLDNAAPLGSPVRPAAGLAGGQKTATAPGAGIKIPCSRYYAQRHVTGLPPQFGGTSFPTDICGYSAGQLRTAYRASASATGRGQTIALVELGLSRDMFLTLQDYARANHMPAPSHQRYVERSLGRGDACGDPFNGEEQMDVEASYDMAPGAKQLVMGGDSCNTGDYGQQGLIDAAVAVLNGSGHKPSATVVSNSWETGDESQAPELTTIEHAFLVRAAAEGVGVYVAAGDGSGVEAPSSDPFAIAVGGTTLGIGRNGRRLFETGWSSGFSIAEDHRWVLQSETGASGGGPSLEWNQPAYQRQVVPWALAHPRRGDHSKGPVRSVPDLSADADPFTGFGLGLLRFPKGKPPVYSETGYGGTSLATPLVAGTVADAQQGQHRPFGFINPVLYRLAGTGAFTDTLPLSGRSPAGFRGVVCGVPDCPFQALITSDDQSTSLYGYTGQVTLSGYDNMTGLGTPNGVAFINALRKLES